jgi:hypothetical protein
LFDSGDFDQERPLECIVAEDLYGKVAIRFQVKRTTIITDEARECGDVKIPADDGEGG